MALARKLVRTMSSQQAAPFTLKYFDIGVNFTDPMFHGLYNGKQHHQSDIEDVILRAKTFNVRKMLLTGSSLRESRRILEIANAYNEDTQQYLYITVGVHPCSVNEITERLIGGESEYLDKLKSLALSGKEAGIVKAFGEIGLDYDRLHYNPKDVQKEFFKKQLDIALEVQLPLFLHMRAANDDFIEILKPYLEKLPKGGVVHSFTGTVEELKLLLDLGLYIGVNGCSLKTEENLKVVKEIPLDKIMIETDAPWCEIKKSSAGYKYLTPYPNETYPKIWTKQSSSLDLTATNDIKPATTLKLDPLLPFPLVKKEHYGKFNPLTRSLVGEHAAPLIKSRNEPVHVGQVVEIISKVKGVSVEDVVNHAWNNTIKLFEIEDEVANEDEFYTY